MPRDVAVFHPGVQHSWQTAQALQELERLSFYATSIFYRPARWPYRIEGYLPAPLAARAHAEFARFSHPALDPALVHTFGVAEWGERLAARLGATGTARRLDRWGNRRFARRLGRLVAARDPAVLWGYNGSSLDTFTDPRNQGRWRVLDRTTGDWRAYNAAMDAIHDRYRAFFPPGEYRIDPAQIDRDDAEYAAADVILTGAPAAAATIAAHAPEAAGRLRVLPYGFDEALFGDLPPPHARDPAEPVRFLMLGQANVRKGVHLVLDAFRRVPASAATLTIVGDLQVPVTTFARYADRVTYRPTSARRDVPALMADADALLLPSYFEGSALTLIEALAAGLALVQSPMAGNGATAATGLMLAEQNEEAVHAAIMTLVDDRQRLAAMRAAAQAEARRYSFAAYCTAIAQLLAERGG